ncbi:MAG: hypothetical protein ACYTA5_26505, partial [Planctomycetota bacterium]
MRSQLKRTLWTLVIATMAAFCLASNAVAWWDANYQYRKKITVTNNSGGTVSVDTLVSFTTDTASLITAGKLRNTETPSNDWRIVYDNGATESEIGQKIESGWNTTSTETWFRLEAAINNGESDSDYYVYYGYSGESTSAASLNPAQYTNVKVYNQDSSGGNSTDLAFDALTAGEWGNAQGFDFDQFYDCWWNITKFRYYVSARAGGTTESLAGFIFDGINKGEGEEIVNGKGDEFANNSVGTGWNEATFSSPYPKVKELTTYYAALLPTNPADRNPAGGSDYIRWDYSTTDADSSNQGYHTDKGASSWQTSIIGARDFTIEVYADEASNDELSASLSDTVTTVTYYFNSYDSVDILWDANPQNVVDNDPNPPTTFGETNSNSEYMYLNGNDCPGTDLGTITDVEVSAWFANNFNNGPGRDVVPRLTPYFNGTDLGADYYQTPGDYDPGPIQGTWHSIEADAAGPGSGNWTWTDVQNLQLKLGAYRPDSGRVEPFKVEIRVTYTNSAPSAPQNPYCEGTTNPTGV